MTGDLYLANRQRARRIDLRFLRQIARSLLDDSLVVREYDLVVHLVSAGEMTRLNETRLRHAGSTDVITFDYAEPDSTAVFGEIFICADEALLQSSRFRVPWQTEVVRYLVHGLLHLRGYDDLRPAARRKMKREENRLVRELSRRFHLSKLERKPTISR